MRDAHSGDDARAVQDHRGGLHLVEERGSTTEQDRYQVEPDLIEQPQLQALPGDRARSNSHRPFGESAESLALLGRATRMSALGPT